MSLFDGLDDGVVEPIPTLIDEDLENLFAGGDDLFEFLDERVPAALVIPPATADAATPVVAPAPTAMESREPPGYIAPVFFPFGKPEPTPPQLKLSGVSSFKKINSRLLQGGALSDREEADAIRELERALGVLGHQRRFLREHRAGLEKWTSVVYGFNLSNEASGAVGDLPNAVGGVEEHIPQEACAAERASLREVRISVKCKGTKRRIDKQPLLAHVDQLWSPRNVRAKNSKKRSSVKTEAEKSAKRGKTPVATVSHDVMGGISSLVNPMKEMVEDEGVDEQSHGLPGVTDAADQGDKMPDDCSSSPSISKTQPLPGDFSTETEDCPGRNSLVSSHAPAAAGESVADTGERNNRFEGDADILRQRLVQALVPAGVDDARISDGELNSHAKVALRKSKTSSAHLDVVRLSLAQRVLVQLHAVGLVTGDSVHVVSSRAGIHALGSRKLVRAGAC